jgi:hypothetical protein
MMKMEALLKKIGGRKFALVLVVFLLTGLFAWLGIIKPEEFSSLTKMLLVAYPAGAIGQSFLVKDLATTTQDVVNQADVRKFGFTILVFVGTAVLLYMQKLTGSAYVEINQWLVGMYVTA